MKEIHDLHAFVDGELKPEEVRKVRAQLAENLSLQAELNSISNLKDFLQEKSSRHSEDDCWKVCVVRLNELDRSRKIEGFMGRYAWAICAGLFLLVIGGRYAVTDVKGETARAADLLQVFHSSPSGPSAQNQRLYSQLIQNSRANRSGVQVLSHASGMVNDVAVDRVVVADHKGRLTYFAIQNVVNFEDASAVSAGSGMSGGIISRSDDAGSDRLSYVIWVDGGQSYVLIGPRSIEDLADAAVNLGLKATPN